jgi:hypothetical protein
MDKSAIEALVDQYEKHDWKLRIVLRSDNSAQSDISLPENVVIEDSELDALWFSRPNGTRESWELRRIGGSPYALVRFVEPDDPEEVRDEILGSAESEMLSASPDPIGN